MTAGTTVVEDFVLAEKSAEAAPVRELSQESFSWTKQWYPVAIATSVEPNRPNPVQLLGRNLVIWLDAAGQWRCFEDRCPHRAAPLSEGKIWEDGTLMCSYHGWRFDSDGDCIRIPQAASAEAEKRACDNRRACATSFPVAEAQGMLFVWGEAGPKAEEEAAARPIPIDGFLQAAEERGDAITYIMPPYFRDLPYDYQTLIENVADPAHVPFSHHGVQGDREKVKYGENEMQVVPEPGKIRVTYTNFMGEANETFEPPGILNIYRLRADNIYFSFKIYCTPTKPGHSRILTISTTNNKKLPFIFNIIKRMPQWLDHVIFRHPVLDGDNVFLHWQEQFLVKKAREAEEREGLSPAAAASAAWRKNYYMATRADALVAAFKNWLDNAGKSGPFGPLHKAPAYPSLVTDHRVLLNRYEQHTKNCRMCKKALTWVETFRAVSAALAAVGFGSAVAAVVQSGASFGLKVLTTRSVAGGALVGFVFSLVWRWLNELRDKFYFVNYDHAIR